MKLSTKGRYGLRAMIELAKNVKNKPLSLNDISKKQGISRKYLHSLLTMLRQADLIYSIKGKDGGYFLSKSPQEINLRDILYPLEGEIFGLDCVIDDGNCTRIGNCEAASFWKLLLEEMQKNLEKYSLADVLANGNCSVDAEPHFDQQEVL
ncbi:MAG: RrF2 family transcriptional regulator [Bacteriovoracia bacterium]